MFETADIFVMVSGASLIWSAVWSAAAVIRRGAK